jgi:hypothetical protein
VLSTTTTNAAKSSHVRVAGLRQVLQLAKPLDLPEALRLARRNTATI